MRNLSRRHVLTGLAVTAGGIAVAGAMGHASGASAMPPPEPAGSKAADNGWPANVRTERFLVEGSLASLLLLPGHTAQILLHVARRFNYDIFSLGEGHIHGQVKKGAVFTAEYEANYSSGTAFAIRPDLFPAGSAGNLFPPQIALIRDILAECDGVVRWGGDELSPKEGHFQIDVPPGDPRVKSVAARLLRWSEQPDEGPGVPVDPFNKKRRAAAVALEREQRRR